MADFLTRLAERTLGVAPMVQPILAPIFAPEPILTSGTHPLEYEDASVIQQILAPEQSLAREALNIEHEDRAVDTVHDNIGPARDRPSPAASRLFRRHAIHPQTPEHAGGQSFLAHDQDAHAHPEQVKHRGRSSKLEDLTIRGVPGAERGIVQGATMPTWSIVSSSTVSGPTANEDSLGTSLSTNWAPLTRALLPVQHLEVSAAEKSTSAPTIRVTIGRIEVRAVMPTKEATVGPPSTRPRPKLSLDDYLKQQNGGQR
ncbi:hypothetical protein [Ktedonobacter racemifer]|uniref:Uncharacterized protein n=1 Tax=Ktedonobacter racemifer DSM 44963 TaxID=485913 RepID=D6TXC0_KTERA|nr:hypothetical protein [Ktedonobacter racemifer]EFH84853.1 hypothetical protein Krac_5968 [Ktedonobacter racemifer DSM 44963]